MSTTRLRAALLLAVLLAALAAVGIITTSDGDDRAGKARTFQQLPPVQAGAPPIDADVDQERQLDEQAEARGPAQGGDRGADFHEDTRDETPAGIDPDVVRDGQKRTEAIAQETLGAPVEPAGAQAYSCRNRPVRNQSALNARRVGTSLHFTVSNPGSINAIFGLFDRSSFGASSNYGFEPFSLRCERWVADNRKAWCQGAANSAYNCIEIISNNRTRAQWLATPMIRTGALAALVRDLTRQVGAPLRLVDPVGCVFPAGITDHDRLECGNSHWDVGPNFPWDVFMRQVRAGTPASASKPPLNLKVLTRGELADATTLLRERRVATRAKGWDRVKPYHLERAVRAKTTLRARNGELHRLGLTRTLNRRARHDVIHRVLRG